MSGTTFERVIRIAEDSIATYERAALVSAVDGMPERRRVIETKRVDALDLFPKRGEVIIGPPNMRTIATDGNITVVVTEEPPQVRTVRWATSYAGKVYNQYSAMHRRLRTGAMHERFGETREVFLRRLETQNVFSLAFPYIVTCYRFVGGRFASASCWYRMQPLTDARSELLVSNIPNNGGNFGEKDHLCYAEPDYHLPTGVIATDIAALALGFWSGVWNDHWTNNFFAAADRIPEVASPWEWERLSRRDPLAVLRLPWESSERTIEEEVRRLLAIPEQRDADAVFTEFANRAQAADPWDEKPQDVAAKVRVSPAQFLVLDRGRELRIGDVITVQTNAFAPCVRGERYTVEWFGRADARDNRVVGLKGIEAPVQLIIQGALDATIKVVTAPVAPVACGGVAIAPGAFVVFDDDEQWSGFDTGCALEIINAHRDLDGYVIVVLKEAEFPVVIGTDAALCEGARVFPKEETDERGNLLRQTFTFADGTTIRIGDPYAIEESDGVLQTGMIRAFRALKHGDEYWSFVNDKADVITFADLAGNIESDCVVGVSTALTAVRVGSQTIAVGDHVAGVQRCRMPHVARQFAAFPNGSVFVKTIDHDWQKIANGATFCPGVTVRPNVKVAVSARGVRAGTAWYPVGMLLFDAATATVRQARAFHDDGHETLVRFADHPNRQTFLQCSVLMNRFTRVVTRWRVLDGAVSLRRELRLRLRVAVPGVVAGTEFRVSHIVPPSSAGADATVVMTDGRCCSANRDALVCFEIPDRAVWRPLIAGEMSSPDTKLASGKRVQYLGGDLNVNREFDERKALSIGATLIELVGYGDDRWLCKFDEEFAGLHNCDGRFKERHYQWIFPQYLAVLGFRAQGFQRAFTPKNGAAAGRRP